MISLTQKKQELEGELNGMIGGAFKDEEQMWKFAEKKFGKKAQISLLEEEIIGE